MKKSLIALAVLATTGAAMAQSSVTLYGRVDAALASTKTTVNGASLTQVGVENGGAAGLTGSRWGLKGTEDLGGGLKAAFVLENRFNVDDGTSTGQFLGNSYVSLAGGFGQVLLGRTYTSFDDARALANANNLWDSAFTPTGDVYNIGTNSNAKNGDYSSRGANQIRYNSPSFSGFSGSLSYALGENKTADKSASSVLGLNLMYKAGPVAVAYGHQEEKAVGGAKNKFDAISGTYNFGVAALGAGYNQRKSDAEGKDKEYSIGVNVPMNAVQFSVGYAYGENELLGVTTDNKGWGLGAKYSMSKRTTLYAGYKNVEGDNIKTVAAVKGTDTTPAKPIQITTDKELFSVGVRHDF